MKLKSLPIKKLLEISNIQMYLFGKRVNYYVASPNDTPDIANNLVIETQDGYAYTLSLDKLVFFNIDSDGSRSSGFFIDDSGKQIHVYFTIETPIDVKKYL